jgi:phytoene dehydrogenase-like protein
MKKCDDIVVGSGISGMTMALLLGMNGRRVMLIEKNPRIGGSVARFYKKGIPFDTGFHFTGGLHKGGILDELLTALEIRDAIHPVFLSEDHANIIKLEAEDKLYALPYGINNIKMRLKSYFPRETAAVDSYFDKVENVCARTPSMNLRSFSIRHQYLDEDFISLKHMVDSLTQNPELKVLLTCMATCYGVKPDEISFADHSRISLGFYESIAHVRGGGDAFVNAFKAKFKEYDIEICCNDYIVDVADIHEKTAGRFVLRSGEEVIAENCVFTIHPAEILKTLPEGHFSKAFFNRISSFESSMGFFMVFTVLGPEYEEPHFDDTVFSILPVSDMNELLDPHYRGTPALLLIKAIEEVRGKDRKTIVALEPSSLAHVKVWEESRTGKRPPGYEEYKQERVDDIMRRIFAMFPEYEHNLEVIDSASVLTYRDYLHNFDGSAYGIKQKMGQFNLIGQLPLRNLYAAGQSALLPGILGAMLSSFVVGRQIIDEEKYSTFLCRNL